MKCRHSIALINVRRVAKNDQRVVSYIIKVKKEFKMTVKAREALSKGLIWTSNDESTCGRKFEANTRYLITGRIIGEKPWVSVCNYVEQWTSLTYKQRKGFRRLYSLGCRCKVREPPSQSYYSYRHMQSNNETASQHRLAARPGYCHWETRWANKYDCQALHSMCTPVTPVFSTHKKLANSKNEMKQHGKHEHQQMKIKKKKKASMLLHECRWTVSPVYRECMQTREENRNSANSNSNFDEP
ncbi:Tissue inhibitor of metalloprotease-like protein [Leptotrombidium deliense]|uniref:Tissue inhibitor of metalloprotease-like protein n=1 Tax=Leptotrombidium deliense TaxID=299467 RepID=A0A443SPF4_9ACAR|nr:Tissue inhibitor of metalloprotease-like protein [Leptotrombidium deliense]